ncbi:MAG: DUF3048 domain-containing protein [Patescibacteria group bacterium]
MENQVPIVEQKIETISRFLDGILVEKGKENKRPVAVVLENLAGAPKPTLTDISVIYEVLVEGGWTRFLAIFDLENLPNDIGPIRSARPYFAELAEEYKSLFIHAGGSPEVLFRLKQKFYQLFDLDEISWQGKYFYRSNEPRPHNLFIKKEKILKFLEENKIEKEVNFSPWLFNKTKKTDLSTETSLKVKNIKITFSSFYEVEWRYDSEKNEYQYWQNNRVFKDRNNQELRVKNLIIQLTKINIIDEIGRLKINLTGQGEAIIFQNGQVIKGRWLKEAGRTRFYDEEGEEIIFLPGKTWIGIVAKNNQVDYY